MVCIKFGFFFHNCLEVQKFFSLTLADEAEQLPEHVDPSTPAVHTPQVHRQVFDDNIPAVDLSPHPAHEQQATLAQVLPSPVTPLQGTPYIDRDTSDTSTGSEDDSLVEHRPDVVINIDTLQVGQSTHTPTRRTRQCPLVPFLDSTMELEKSNIHTSF